MKMVRSVTALVATTMLATSVTPALAQGYPGGYGNYGGRYGDRHHDRGVSAGDVIAGVAVIGVIAAIASAAGKSSRDRGYNNGYRGDIRTEGQAADACTVRVEQQAGARVSSIDQVYRTRDGYQVTGTVDARGYRNDRDDRYGRGYDNGQRFTCAVRYGQVDDVRIDGGYAYRGY